MNYYRHFAAQTLSEELRSPLVYLLAVLYAALGLILLVPLGRSGLPPEKLRFLGVALTLNGLSFLGYVGIFFASQRAFFREKKARTLTMTLCSPASLGEVFWGKVAGLTAAGFALPALALLIVSAVFAPRALAALASWEAAAGLLLVLAAQAVCAAVTGMFMLSARDERSIAVVLYFFFGLQSALAVLAKSAAGKALFSGLLLQYGAVTAATALLAAAGYRLFFSKMRVVESA